LPFNGHWTLNGLTLSGAGLTEAIYNNCLVAVTSGSAISEAFYTGVLGQAAINLNKYYGTAWGALGIKIEYRTATTEGGLAPSGWNLYNKSIGFVTKGWVQIKATIDILYSSSSSSTSSS